MSLKDTTVFQYEGESYEVKTFMIQKDLRLLIFTAFRNSNPTRSLQKIVRYDNSKWDIVKVVGDSQLKAFRCERRT